VDENFVEDRFGTRQGAIFKPVTRELFTDSGPDWTAYTQAYDPKTDLTEAEKQRVIALGRLVSGATDEEFAARIGDYVDLDDFAEYSALLVWLANRDNAFETGQNVYVYLHPGTNRMYFIAWDQDFSFGTVRDKMGALVDPFRWSGHPFLSRLHKIDAFRSKYLVRMTEFSERLFVPERFMRQISEIAPALRLSIQLEGTQGLAAFDQVASGGVGIVPNATSRAAIVNRGARTGRSVALGGSPLSAPTVRPSRRRSQRPDRHRCVATCESPSLRSSPRAMGCNGHAGKFESDPLRQIRAGVALRSALLSTAPPARHGARGNCDLEVEDFARPR
jgi:hypothetical protein